MQSFDTNDIESRPAREFSRTIIIGRVEELPPGSCQSVELPPEREIALYNIDGEFYAIANFCHHMANEK
jgi:nitrite reductase/ring-hydroxylating ferredoxin subunit